MDSRFVVEPASDQPSHWQVRDLDPAGAGVSHRRFGSAATAADFAAKLEARFGYLDETAADFATKLEARFGYLDEYDEEAS